MAQAEGMADLVDRLLDGSLQKLPLPAVREPCQGNDPLPVVQVRDAEHEIHGRLEEVRRGHPEDAIPRLITTIREERRRAVLPSSGIEGLRRQRGLVHDDDLVEGLELLLEMPEDLQIDGPEGLEGQPHPFTTPSGTIRATIFVRPAPSATRTTSSTFLYAPGASSTIPALVAAWR